MDSIVTKPRTLDDEADSLLNVKWRIADAIRAVPSADSPQSPRMRDVWSVIDGELADLRDYVNAALKEIGAS